jgi:tRNA (cmo5U34)-methyltransferase
MLATSGATRLAFGVTTTLPATASEYFGSMIDSYDSLIERAVPRYHEMTDRLLEYLPDAEQASRILELGCGTGNLSLRLAARFADAAISFVDASPEMVDLTRDRIARHHPGVLARASFVTARFEALEIASGSFDLITSCISLHHVIDKRSLYQRLFTLLSPGGTFRFADQLAGSSPFNHDLNWRQWLEFCRESSHCSEAEIQSLLDHAAVHDHYTPLDEHFDLLRAAGFTQLDCVWRNLIWGIVTTEKP